MAVQEAEIIKHIERSNIVMESLDKRLGSVESDIKTVAKTLPTLATPGQIKEALVEHANNCPMPREVQTLSQNLQDHSAALEKDRARWPASIQGWLQLVLTLAAVLTILYGGITWVGKMNAMAASPKQQTTENQVLVQQLQLLTEELKALHQKTHEDRAPVGSPGPASPTVKP